MDIISQLQEQLNEIAMVSVNTFGTLQPPGPTCARCAAAPLLPQAQPQPALDLDEQPKAMSHALVLAAKKAENEVVGLELQKQLEAAELELHRVEVLFNEATDNCINLKKPD
ncbi:hypothetical protein ZWY2020_003586 [Hordeum vulgare]|nr:hypothetical protein ZWY2020_003586 [Hordeum vulgare]